MFVGLAIRKLWRTVCVSIGLVTLNFLTLKLVCQSYLRWGTLLPNSASRIFRYVRYGRTDGQTNKRTDKINAYCLFPTGGSIIKDCARCIVLLKLTIKRHEALRGGSATAELLVIKFVKITDADEIMNP